MSVVEEVKQRTDITEIVSQYAQLQKAGKNLRARCPFHQERTPSFYVFPETQTWRCFGACSTGGDAIGFLQRAENLDFGEALRRLAKAAGVSLPSRGEPSRFERLYAVNQEAASFYHRQLRTAAGRHALRYVERRGISDEAVDAFGLGYSPGGRALKRHLLELGCREADLVEAGLLRGEAGDSGDMFWNRLMVPIRDMNSRVVGFGARELDGSTPKYLNTPRTVLFDKSATLYGLDLAAPAIRHEGMGAVVEGYMDVIAAHQHGFTNVVASMGTALTAGQLTALRQFSAAFVLALDPDAAGQSATLQRLEEAAYSFEQARGAAAHRSGRVGPIFAAPARHFSLRVAVLPEGRDPDELVRRDPEAWKRAVADAVPLMDYLLQAMAGRYDLTSAEGKAAAAERLVPLIYSQVENFLEQDRHFQRLADLLGVTRQTLEASVGAPAGRTPQRAARRRRPGEQRETASASTSPFARGQSDPLEEYCLALLVQHPDLAEEVEDVPEDLFTRGENRELFSRGARSGTLDQVKDLLDPYLSDHLATLQARDLPPLDAQERRQALRDVLRRLQQRRLREAKVHESQRLREANTRESPDWEDQALKTNEELRALFLQHERRSQPI